MGISLLGDLQCRVELRLYLGDSLDLHSASTLDDILDHVLCVL